MANQDLQSIAFPKFDDQRMSDFGQCPLTVPKKFRDGDAFFRTGDSDGKFFIVISGQVEIIDETGDQPKAVVIHHPGQFAGDVSQITNRPAIVSG